MKKFEEFLKEKHAEDYHGTDDNMPDAFEGWLENLDIDEVIAFADEYGAEIESNKLSLWTK